MECAGRCWAGRCCQRACLLPRSGEEPGCLLPGPCHTRLVTRWASLPPSPLGNGTEGRAVTRAGPGPRSRVNPRQGTDPASPTERSKRDPFQKNKESLTLPAPSSPKRSQTPGVGSSGKQAAPRDGSAFTPDGKGDRSGAKLALGPLGGELVSSRDPGRGVQPQKQAACRPSPRTPAHWLVCSEQR